MTRMKRNRMVFIQEPEKEEEEEEEERGRCVEDKL